MKHHKALILTWDGFQDQEVIYPYYRLQEEGFHVDVLGKTLGTDVVGLFGIKFPCTITPSELSYTYSEDGMFGGKQILLSTKEYSLLVIPGGVKALEKLRQETKVLRFIKDWDNQGKIISST